MKTTELAMRAYETGRPHAAITFGNEWITIRVKFPNRQTFKVHYPAIMAPYENGQHLCICEHVYEAANYWYKMANSMAATEHEQENRKIMCSRSHILSKLCSRFLDTVA